MSDFDAIVVGAGPSGVACAITMARGGMKVALLERGAFPGAKNLMGGVLYTDVLAKLMPDFVQRGAPLERHVHEKRVSYVSTTSTQTFSFKTTDWDKPPHNHSFTVLRSRFDRWFAQEAEKEGVELICGVVVDGFTKDDLGRINGVVTRMPEGENPKDGELSAPLVILAEGANSLLAEKEGLRQPGSVRDAALCVKEVLQIPAIEDRFLLEGNQGVAWEIVGDATAGLPGAGFVYTNKDTISLGLVLFLDELKESGLAPYEILDRFKAHPDVAPIVKGAELLEYSAHLIPEVGFSRLPMRVKDGLLAVGDCAGLISPGPRHEGSNFAMKSGILAGETALAAFEAKDFSYPKLSAYNTKLAESFVLKNIERYGEWPEFLRDNPQIFTTWPAGSADMIKAALTIENKDADVESQLFDLFQRRIGILPFATTVFKLRNALKIMGYGKTGGIMDYIARNW